MLRIVDCNLISFHRKLLNAPERMRLYRQAIHSVVRPGDVVIDLGCGSGILGLFACQAGARRVYAIERSGAINVARNLAIANGFSNRIEYINQDIKDVRLDEPADVIVSELISKGVIGQKMAESIGYCRERFLKPGGRIIPEIVDLYVSPVEDTELYRKIQLPDQPEYDIDFSTLAKHAHNCPISAHVSDSALLAPGSVAYHYEATTSITADVFSRCIQFDVKRAATVHGFALWFSSLLAPEIVLSNAPPGIAAWDNLFLPLKHPVPVLPSMTVELSIMGRDDEKMASMWRWDTIIKNGNEVISRQQQSTFYANVLPVNSDE